MAAPTEIYALKNKMCNIEIYRELEVDIRKHVESARPGKHTTFLNPKMRTNRELIILALAVKVRGQSDDVTSCLDAFAASGIQALQWKKQFGSKVIVTANDVKPEAVSGIHENCRLNGCDIQVDAAESQSQSSIEVACRNANVLLHERAFKFVHLDPFGTSVNFLDAAFSNLPNGGILSVTSTDVSAFLGKCPQVTERHYNGHIVKCEYLPELACRLIVASLVRAAARCHKGLEVLFVFAKEHFILTVVRVRRGYKKADESLRQLQRLLHCNLCEERVFLKEALLAEDNMYHHLPCSCFKSNPGKTASLLGPVWSGSIFNQAFVTEMLSSSGGIPLSTEVKGILEKMQEELGICRESRAVPSKSMGKREGDFQDGPNVKIMKVDLKLSTAADAVKSDFDGSKKRPGMDQEMAAKSGELTEHHQNLIASHSRLSPGSGVILGSNQTAVEKCVTNPSTLKEHNSGRQDVSPERKVCVLNACKDTKETDGGTNAAKDIKLLHGAEGKTVPFFYTILRHCPDKGNWPRMKVVIDNLRTRGHQASLTVFHNHGVRTTATLEQFVQTLKEIPK